MKRARVFFAMVSLLWMANANALSVSLIYTGGNDVNDSGAIVAQGGDTLLFDLVMDFTENPTLGGGFDVNWDPNVFTFNSYISSGLGDPLFARDPIEQDGRLFNGAVGSFTGILTGLIAQLSFTYLGGIGEIAPSGTTGDSGPWIDGLSFVDEPLLPDYIGVRVVPVPAAAWLMLSGLGALAAFRPRRVARQ